MRGPFKNEQGQIARALIVVVIEGKLLLAMCGVGRMVEVEDDRRWRLRVAGKEMVHKCLCEAIEIGAGHTVFKPGEGWGTRQVLGRIKRDAFDA
jgi:hypothetical protein